MREIEIKIRVKNLKDVERRLLERGCVLSEPISQHDINYSRDNSTEEFSAAKEGDIIIRIRKMKVGSQLNLKQQLKSEEDSLEYETEVTDANQIDKMLKLLGWKPLVEVKKLRRKGKIGEYEVCLDEVEHLGSFIELESLTEDTTNPEEVKEKLFKELESLGLSREDQELKRYDTQMYEFNHKINS